MKNKISAVIALALAVIFVLTGCSGGNVDSVEKTNSSSDIYSSKDIEAAYQAVEDYFNEKFSGCTLKTLYYAGDEYGDKFTELAGQYDADEVIIIKSTFETGSSGGDGSLEPNYTYDDWNWVLIRNNGGEWQHVDHGYGI